ncbi:MAG: DRTGG domain-containing protein [Candidatus Thorarchaeota archaeon]
MAKNVIVTGEAGTGKTMAALAIAAELRAKGKKVGYFKPAGEKSFKRSTEGTIIDEDAAVMKDVLNLEADVSCICPIPQSHSSFDELTRIGQADLEKKILECYEEVSKGMDVVVIEGTRNPWQLLHVNLSTPQIAQLLEASVVCLVNFTELSATDNILHLKSFFNQHGIDSMGVVLTMVPPMLKNTIENEIPGFMKEHGLELCGVIYHRRELFNPTIRDIQLALDGEMIVGDKKLDRLIDQFFIGSMLPENALKWFRRARDSAVITGGDRADLCLAAMETEVALLILTGGLGPDIRTISRAKETGVSIMMTALDTYATGGVVNGLIGTVSAENKQKIKTIERIVGAALDLSFLNLT